MTLRNLLGVSLEAVTTNRGAGRAVARYSGASIAESAATDCVRAATELHGQVKAWLRAHRTDLA